MILKLVGIIDWSWWYVTLPFWGPFAILIGIGLLIGLVAFLVWLIKWTVRRIRGAIRRRAVGKA